MERHQRDSIRLHLGRVLAARDLDFLPWMRTPARWNWCCTWPKQGEEIWSFTLSKPPQRDIFSSITFQVVGDFDQLRAKHVVVCADPDKVSAGFIGALALLVPRLPLYTLKKPPVGHGRVVSIYRPWAVFTSPEEHDVAFTVEEVRQEAKHAESHGLQGLLVELGPPAVNFDLLAAAGCVTGSTMAAYRGARAEVLDSVRDMLRLRITQAWPAELRTFFLDIGRANHRMLLRVVPDLIVTRRLGQTLTQWGSWLKIARLHDEPKAGE